MKPYYERDGITIYHGDCREILPTLPKVDLVLTDPPYGTQDLGGGYGRRQLHSTDGRNGRLIANDTDLSVIKGIAPLLFEHTCGDAWLMSFCAPRRMIETASVFTDAGFGFIGHVVWDKGQPGLGYTIRYSHEDVLVFGKGEPPRPEPALISVIRATGSRANLDHPHEKPLEVLIRLLSVCGGRSLTLDPCMGSGSTLVAAKRLGRKAIGIEIEERYCAIAAERLERERLTLFEHAGIAQEPLPWDEPGPAHSTEWGRLQGERDAIVEEAFEHEKATDSGNNGGRVISGHYPSTSDDEAA